MKYLMPTTIFFLYVRHIETKKKKRGVIFSIVL